MQFRIVLTALAVILTSNAAGSPPQITLTDDLQRQVTLPRSASRIVSLAPSITESLFAIGAGDQVIGVTDYCNFPPEARSCRRVGGMINPSIETIVGLAPDLIVVSMEGNTRQDFTTLTALRIPVFVCNPRSFEGINRSLRQLGSLTGRLREATRLTDSLSRRAARLRIEGSQTAHAHAASRIRSAPDCSRRGHVSPRAHHRGRRVEPCGVHRADVSVSQPRNGSHGGPGCAPCYLRCPRFFRNPRLTLSGMDTVVGCPHGSCVSCRCRSRFPSRPPGRGRARHCSCRYFTQDAHDSPAHVFVAVAGNIGSGKSSLTRLLSRPRGGRPMYESVEDNPYLSDFYKDMRRWSFQLQVYFLSNRFRSPQVDHRRIAFGGARPGDL